MKLLKTAVIALALGSIPMGGCAAGTFRQAPADTLAKADLDHDGVVTKAEFINARNAQFKQLDRGHKGVLSVNAVPGFMASTARGAAASELLRSADRNHDGQVTWAEFATAPTPTFDRADIDHNGRLDWSEQSFFVRLVERER